MVTKDHTYFNKPATKNLKVCLSMYDISLPPDIKRVQCTLALQSQDSKWTQHTYVYFWFNFLPLLSSWFISKNSNRSKFSSKLNRTIAEIFLLYFQGSLFYRAWNEKNQNFSGFWPWPLQGVLTALSSFQLPFYVPLARPCFVSQKHRCAHIFPYYPLAGGIQ